MLIGLSAGLASTLSWVVIDSIIEMERRLDGLDSRISVLEARMEDTKVRQRNIIVWPQSP